MEASTRVPTAKGAEMQALDEKLLVDWSVMKTNPDLVSSNLDVLKDSDLGVAYRWDETQTPEQQIEGFIDFARDNLVWLHERMNPEWRARQAVVCRRASHRRLDGEAVQHLAHAGSRHPGCAVSAEELVRERQHGGQDRRHPVLQARRDVDSRDGGFVAEAHGVEGCQRRHLEAEAGFA
jgi:hypothetical protein